MLRIVLIQAAMPSRCRTRYDSPPDGVLYYYCLRDNAYTTRKHHCGSLTYSLNNSIDAGKTFEKAADVQTNKLNEPDDAANTLVDAFKAYRKEDPPPPFDVCSSP